MQFLVIGAPPGARVNGDLFSWEYFQTITHDEDQILFGGPNCTRGEMAFQRLVSTIMKEEEQREAYWVEQDLYHLMECTSDAEGDDRDVQYFTASLNEQQLRLTRLTKDFKWLEHS
jgi:hypothetical protein